MMDQDRVGLGLDRGFNQGLIGGHAGHDFGNGLAGIQLQSVGAIVLEQLRL